MTGVDRHEEENKMRILRISTNGYTDIMKATNLQLCLTARKANGKNQIRKRQYIF